MFRDCDRLVGFKAREPAMIFHEQAATCWACSFLLSSNLSSYLVPSSPFLPLSSFSEDDADCGLFDEATDTDGEDDADCARARARERAPISFYFFGKKWSQVRPY